MSFFFFIKCNKQWRYWKYRMLYNFTIFSNLLHTDQWPNTSLLSEPINDWSLHTCYSVNVQTTGDIVAVFQQQSDVTFYKKYITKSRDLPVRMKSIAKKQKWKHWKWILIDHKWGYRRAVRMRRVLPSGKPNVQPEDLCEGKYINIKRKWLCEEDEDVPEAVTPAKGGCLYIKRTLMWCILWH